MNDAPISSDGGQHPRQKQIPIFRLNQYGASMHKKTVADSLGGITLTVVYFKWQAQMSVVTKSSSDGGVSLQLRIVRGHERATIIQQPPEARFYRKV